MDGQSGPAFTPFDGTIDPRLIQLSTNEDLPFLLPPAGSEPAPSDPSMNG